MTITSTLRSIAQTATYSIVRLEPASIVAARTRYQLTLPVGGTAWTTCPLALSRKRRRQARSMTADLPASKTRNGISATMASSTFPDDDGYKSPIFLYLAYHGKNEMQQTNMDLEDQYAFGEDPGLLENLEIGEELAANLDDDDTQEDDPCNFAAETPGEAALGDEAAAEAHFLIRDEDGDE